MPFVTIGLLVPTTTAPEQRETTPRPTYYTVAKEPWRQDAAINLQKFDDFLEDRCARIPITTGCRTICSPWKPNSSTRE
jgi:hypothetical protein